MYDKTIRRRRALLGLLVALSLTLLTAYFGERSGGALHSVQSGFLTIVSPLQDGADKVLKPVRDLFGWFGSTLHAKSQNKQLRKQLAQARAQLSANQIDEHAYRKLLSIYRLDGTLHSLSGYTLVNATVFYKSPNLWYSTITIDKGSSAGVQVDDPVIDGEGLVGKVTQVAPDGALVSLITDSAVEVTAKIAATGAVGIVQPEVGEPGRLLMQYLPAGTHASRGELVVTSGTISNRGDSLYPEGIPIGTVASTNEQSAYKSLNVSPLVDFHNLDFVQVLTHSSGSHVARLGRSVRTLLPANRPGGEGGGAGGEGTGGAGGEGTGGAGGEGTGGPGGEEAAGEGEASG